MVEGRILLNKTLQVPKELNSSGNLRIYCGVAEPSTIKISIRHAGRLHSKIHTFSKVLGGWINIPLDKIVSEEHKINFEIEVHSLKPAGVFYTPQRNYGRSLLNGQALDGEWVIQLKIDK